MICYLFREHSRNPVFVVVLDISCNLSLNSRPEPFGSFAVRGPWLEVSRFLAEVVILERLFRPGEPICGEQVEKTKNLGSENLPSPRSLWSVTIP